MKLRKLAVVVILSGAIMGHGQTPPAEQGFVFQGVEVSAKTPEGEAPVVSAGRWGLRADTTKGIKRFGYSSDFRIHPVTAYDRELVEISSFDVDLSFSRRSELETMAMADLQQYQVETDIAISDLTRWGTNHSGATQNRILDLEKEYENFEENVRSSLENDDFGSTELDDTISLTLKLQSPREIADAFCVFIARYNVPNPKFPGGRQWIASGRVQRVGHLSADKLRKVKLRFRVRAGYLENARYEFYLLSDSAENIATSRSPNLRSVAVVE